MRFLPLLLVCLCACAGSQRSAKARGAEQGMASFYADSLAGRPTASGEPYNPEAATCAHRTHTMGTRLRVIREDGRAVVCRVNDRGPFVGGRVVDLSRKGARDLGIISQGVAPVRVEVVSKPARKQRRRS